MEQVSWEVLVFMAVSGSEPEKRRADAVAEMERRLGDRRAVCKTVVDRFTGASLLPIGLVFDWEPGLLPREEVVNIVGPKILDRTMEEVAAMLWSLG
jgi:hypothetical protein